MLEFKYIKNKYWQAFVLSFILALLLLLPISLRDAIQGNVEKEEPDILFIHDCQFIDICDLAKYVKKHNSVRTYAFHPSDGNDI